MVSSTSRCNSGINAEGSFTRNQPRHSTAAFPGRKYEYEWHDSSFFEKGAQASNDAFLGAGSSPATQQSPKDILHFAPSPPPESGGRLQNRAGLPTQVNIWDLNLRMERFVLMEVAWGTHQLVEMAMSDVIRRVREHTNGQTAGTGYSVKAQVPELTYRDIRQVFSPGSQAPSLEIRRNCIIVCLPPLVALLFHDRCVFLVNDEMDTDSLLLRLEDITATYSSKSAETESYFQQEEEDAQREAEEVLPSPPHMQPVPKTTGKGEMLLGRSTNRHMDSMATTSPAPKFVSFPLEFAMLEILISSAFEAVNAEIESLETRQDKIMKRVINKKQPGRDKLEDLHDIKEPAEALLDRVLSLGKTFRELIGESEDLVFMELTRLYYRPQLYHTEFTKQEANTMVNANLEILLEFFDQEIDQFERRAQKLIRALDNAERFINLRMALTRNELVYWELNATILAVGLAAGSCISGVFGMNLTSGIETNTWVFPFFVAMIILFAVSGVAGVAIIQTRYRC